MSDAPIDRHETLRLKFKEAMDWGRSYGTRLNLSSITVQDVSGQYADIALAQLDALAKAAPTFQARVQPWLLACFGELIAGDREERNHRFLEEALELVQASGCSASEAHQLVDYVYGRPVGEPAQEVGGVMVTLAALCLANGLDMHTAAETELARIWTMVEKIRAKQAAKPKHSPLPQAAAADRPERPHIDANALEAMARERPNDMFLRGSGVHKLTGAIRQLEAKVRALHAEPPAPLWPVEQIASDVCQAVSELGDRNSPEGQPAMMLVTAEELFDIVKEAVNAATQPPQEVPHV